MNLLKLKLKIDQLTKYRGFHEHQLQICNKQNIEKLKNSKKPLQHDKEFIKTLTDLFTKNTFMIQQIVKMGELNEMNENDLRKATDTIRELNNLCSLIYGFGD